MGGDLAISALPGKPPRADALAAGEIQGAQIGVQTTQCGVVAGEQGIHIPFGVFPGGARRTHDRAEVAAVFLRWGEAEFGLHIQSFETCSLLAREACPQLHILGRGIGRGDCPAA